MYDANISQIHRGGNGAIAAVDRGFSTRGAQYSPPGAGPTPDIPDWCVNQSASSSGCWFTEGWVPPRSEEVYSEVWVWVARSPFRESSEGSMISRSSRRGRTPHRTGKFNITAQEQNSSLVIPATNPNDYTVPSPFRSTSDSEDEEVIADSQAVHSQTASSRRRDSFNLTVPESMLEHLRLQRSQQADGQSRGNRSDHHSGISLADQHIDQLDQYDGHQGGEEEFDRSRQEMFEEGNQYDDRMAYRNDNDDVDDDDDERTEYTSRLENRERDHYVHQEMYDRDDGLEQYQDEEMDDDQSEPSGQYREKSGHDESESLREHGGDGLKILPEGGIRSDMSNIGMAEVENGTYVGRDESASRSRRSLSNMEMADAESGMYVDRDDGGNRSRRSLSNMEMTDAESRMYVGRDEIASRSHRSVSNMEMTDVETGMYLNKDESTSRSYRSLSRSRDDLAASRSDISRRRQSSFSAVSPEVDTMTRHLSTSVDLERSMRARDQERMGRYSEGHKSRFGSPSRSEKDLRLSDGHLHGKGSPFDMQRLNSSYEHQNRENQSRSASRSVGNRSSRDLNISSRSRHSSDDMYQSPRSLLSGRRSPSIASTPRVQEDWESGSERGDGNSPLKAVTPSPVVSPRGASPASSSHRSQGSARMSRVSDGSSPRLQGSPSASLRSTSRSMQRSSPRTPGSNKGTPKSEKSVLGSSTRHMGLSQASPVIAGKRHGSAEVDALPHQTMLFSPPIASTQNIGALSRRLSPQPSTSRQSRITDFVQQTEGENTNITSTAAEITPKEEGCAKTSSEVSLPDTNFNSEETFQPFCRHASETYWDNLCADLEAYARHAGRKRIQMADFELLFKRQGYVTEKTSLNSLIRRYLPWEEADKLIPVIGADNKIYPKL
ncbi:CENPT-like protein [Mya arenaria]|uniref:CENPT-like protein n=1 Tax=Mya arenaria TaxID=6604 RepID=A0ABY7EUH9_MYAAR|nr:CENPT-like protein [Mya arenaria]